MFIDCLEIPLNSLVPIESMFFNKLFTLIVEDSDKISKITELNRKLKGGRIRVFPL